MQLTLLQQVSTNATFEPNHVLHSVTLVDRKAESVCHYSSSKVSVVDIHCSSQKHLWRRSERRGRWKWRWHCDISPLLFLAALAFYINNINEHTIISCPSSISYKNMFFLSSSFPMLPQPTRPLCCFMAPLLLLLILPCMLHLLGHDMLHDIGIAWLVLAKHILLEWNDWNHDCWWQKSSSCMGALLVLLHTKNKSLNQNSINILPSQLLLLKCQLPASIRSWQKIKSSSHSFSGCPSRKCRHSKRRTTIRANECSSCGSRSVRCVCRSEKHTK